MPPRLSAEDSHQVLIRMSPEMHAAVKAHAEANDRTMAATIRRAVRLYLASPSSSPEDR